MRTTAAVVTAKVLLTNNRLEWEGEGRLLHHVCHRLTRKLLPLREPLIARRCSLSLQHVCSRLSVHMLAAAVPLLDSCRTPAVSVGWV